MSSSASAIVATTANVDQVSHFMRLPTEVREMIYRPLLVARYTMTEHNMTSREYDNQRRSILHGPDQTYHFNTAILATNRRIHGEARDLCRRENDFVCLTSLRPSRLGCELEKRGLQMIARCSKACSFWNPSMTLRLDLDTLSGWPMVQSQQYGYKWGYEEMEDVPQQYEYQWKHEDMEDVPKDGQPWNYIFCCEELPEFCRILLEVGRDGGSIIRDTALFLELNPTLGNGQTSEIDGNPAGLLRMRKLLSPLRQLHSLGAAQVDGPLSSKYKQDIIANVCKSCPSAMEMIESTMDILNLADQQADKGQFRYANLGYKAALSFIDSCHWQWDEYDFIMDSGPFPGLQAFQVVKNISVRLQARIAAVYFESGQLRMARIYTERALDPRRGFDRRGNKEREIVVKPWEEIAYAEVLHVAAKISYTHGDVREALYDLQFAGQFVGLNEEQESRKEAWQAHQDRLWAKRHNAWDTTDERKTKRIEKAEGKIQVVCNWKKKGDALVESGRSILAASTYQTTLHKLNLLTQNFDIYFEITANFYEGHSAVGAINSLTLKLKAGLSTACLMSGKYEEVRHLTDSVLNSSLAPDNCKEQRYCYRKRIFCDTDQLWMDDHKLDYSKIHYCKAQSLKHSGDTKRAIQHMKKALSFDPRDGTVSAQLVLLKQQRAKRLNFLQNQLQKKQAKRREKARL